MELIDWQTRGGGGSPVKKQPPTRMYHERPNSHARASAVTRADAAAPYRPRTPLRLARVLGQWALGGNGMGHATALRRHPGSGLRERGFGRAAERGRFRDRWGPGG